MLKALAHWLGSTALSVKLQTTSWAIPDLQSVHIIALAFLMASAWLLDLRLLGFRPHSNSVVATARRFLPWTWWPLGLLVLSGGLLVAAEPGELLGNEVFLLKMALLAVAIVVTLVLQHLALKTPMGAAAATLPTANPALKALAALSLLLWVAIAFAGRLIAYVD